VILGLGARQSWCDPETPTAALTAVDTATTFAHRTFYVASSDRILQVDSQTGDRTVISGYDADAGSWVGSGPDFLYLGGIAVLDANTLFVNDIGSLSSPTPRILRVDVATGDRQLVSDLQNPAQGPAWTQAALYLDVAPPSVAYVHNYTTGLYEIDLTSGQRRFVLTVSPLTSGSDIEVVDADTLLCAGGGANYLFGFSDLSATTPTISLLSSGTIGSGPAPGTFQGAIDRDPDGSVVLCDTQNFRLLRIDPVTGDRQIISDSSQSTPYSLCQFFDVAVEPDGVISSFDRDHHALLRVDPATGERLVMSGDPSGENVGSGLDLNPGGVPAFIALAPSPEPPAEVPGWLLYH